MDNQMLMLVGICLVCFFGGVLVLLNMRYKK